MRRLIYTMVALMVGATGVGAAIALAAGESTGTNTVCATATVPSHAVGVDGKSVFTIPAASVQKCKTVTFTVPTVVQTVTAPADTGTTPPATSSTSSSTSSSSSTTSSTTTTAPPPPPPPGSTVDCPLTHAAGADPLTSCWATHTGVQGSTGVTEAQIKAGAPGFTKHNGELDITQPNTTIDHMWVNGCISIADGANNTTIRNSLVTSGGGCSGDDAGGSAINTGQGAKIAKNTLIEDVTVDGGTPGYGSHDAGITVDGGTVLRVNLFGFAQGFISDSNTASAPALFQDDYGHGYRGCSHDDGTWFNSSSFVTFEHGWVMTDDATQPSNGEGCSTAALAGGSDYGPQDHVVFDNSYGEGVTGEDTHSGCGSTDSTITNNALSNNAKGFGSGFVASDRGNSWAGNTVAESGAAIPYNSGMGC